MAGMGPRCRRAVRRCQEPALGHAIRSHDEGHQHHALAERLDERRACRADLTPERLRGVEPRRPRVLRQCRESRTAKDGSTAMLRRRAASRTARTRPPALSCARRAASVLALKLSVLGRPGSTRLCSREKRTASLRRVHAEFLVERLETVLHRVRRDLEQPRDLLVRVARFRCHSVMISGWLRSSGCRASAAYRSSALRMRRRKFSRKRSVLPGAEYRGSLVAAVGHEAPAIDERADEPLEHRHAHGFVEPDYRLALLAGHTVRVRSEDAERDQKPSMSVLTCPSLRALELLRALQRDRPRRGAAW